MKRKRRMRNKWFILWLSMLISFFFPRIHSLSGVHDLNVYDTGHETYDWIGCPFWFIVVVLRTEDQFEVMRLRDYELVENHLMLNWTSGSMIYFSNCMYIVHVKCYPARLSEHMTCDLQEKFHVPFVSWSLLILGFGYAYCCKPKWSLWEGIPILDIEGTIGLV